VVRVSLVRKSGSGSRAADAQKLPRSAAQRAARCHTSLARSFDWHKTLKAIQRVWRVLTGHQQSTSVTASPLHSAAESNRALSSVFRQHNHSATK